MSHNAVATATVCLFFCKPKGDAHNHHLVTLAVSGDITAAVRSLLTLAGGLTDVEVREFVQRPSPAPSTSLTERILL